MYTYFLTIVHPVGILEFPNSSGSAVGQVNVPVEETFSTQLYVAFVGQAEKLILMLFSLVHP
jgi:hypothetical protein